MLHSNSNGATSSHTKKHWVHCLLTQASWADACPIECVLRMSTTAEQMVFLLGGAAAEWAADTWAGIVALLILKLAIQNGGFHGFIHETDVLLRQRDDSEPLRFPRGANTARHHSRHD